MPFPTFRAAALALVVWLAGPAAAQAPSATAGGLARCWLPGLEQQALCGSVKRPLDPARPAGTAIDVHFAVLPALARHGRPDPVFFFAGGPGQSAMDLAAPLARQFSRLLNGRDLVLIDQRGTGRSAPLKCPDDEERAVTQPLAQRLDQAAQLQRLQQCRAGLQRLPHGDLRHYTTPVAMADAEAVRAALGADKLNLVGGSYGTRAALEYLRQFPQHVRRVVIDGVAPPDMALAASFSTDNQAALDALFTWCAADAACKARHSGLRAQWQALLASLPRSVSVTDPFSGRPETVTLTRHAVLDAVRNALYLPLAASALPQALAQAGAGDFGALLALPSMLGGGAGGLATGMHFSVVCSEDAQSPSPRSAPGADFGDLFERQYREVCADWPRATLPAAFYSVPVSPAPVLVLSGAIDPATPPRHGESVARALGPKARHVVVPNAGHGVLSLACQNEVMNRFIRADTDAAALQVDTGCAKDLPRPPAARALGGAGARP